MEQLKFGWEIWIEKCKKHFTKKLKKVLIITQLKKESLGLEKNLE